MTETIKLIDKDYKSPLMNIIKDLRKTYTMKREMDIIKKKPSQISRAEN